MSETESEKIAVLIICDECGAENWRTGPRFAVISNMIDGEYECEGCGRELDRVGDTE
jgi:DNA-directed RNA polymerase subunit RPC12/RpoP